MSTAEVDSYIAALPEWQRQNLTRFREVVHKAAPSVEEGWKWSVPVFLANGRTVLAMSAFAKHTKYNFFDGASLSDPDHLFNNGLDSKKSRSIDLAQDDSIDAAALNRLVAAALSAAGTASGKRSR